MLKPEFLKMIAALDDGRFASLAETLTETAPEVSVRLNPRKLSPGGEAPFPGEPVPWCEGGIYLSERPKFTFDPALHQGVYYVQDASSMIMGAVAAELSRRLAGGPLLWLDACAAPGGKTTAALDALPSGSLVVANEFDYGRAEILAENVAKWGSSYTVVTRGDTARCRAVGEVFDVVAVDAPCSGEGMMRKDATARQQWTASLVEECVARQKEILSNVWDALRPGGYLVYSTCTFNTRENEEMVEWLCGEYGAEPVDMEFPFGIDGAVGSDLPALRFIPGRVRGEGLFMAVVRKPGEWTPRECPGENTPGKGRKGTGKRKRGVKAPEVPSEVRAWITPGERENFPLTATENGLRAFPAQWSDLLSLFLKKLQVISAGTELAETRGHDVVPTQALALSTLLDADAFPRVETDRETALAYLRREAVALPRETPRGFVLLTYGGRPLGFVKNLGNRANNLYPKEWRIKSIQKS